MSENKVLKGINFPGLEGTYYVPEAIAVEDENGYIEIKSYVSDTVEIENLDTTLAKSGMAADAAAVGTALSGKAGAGYGLGEMVTCNAGHDDANDVAGTGWYSAGTNTPDGTRWVIHVIQDFQDRTPHTIQIGYKDGLVARRTLNDDQTWTEWEWENPPYQFNKVYRTTERYRGYPVYAFLLSTGGFASGYLNFTTAKGFTDDPDYVAGGWTVISYDRTVIHDGFYGAGMMESTGDYSLDKYVENIRGDFTDNGLSVTFTLKSNSNSIGNDAYMNLVVKFVKQHV